MTTAVTVSAAPALLPSLLAVIVAVPAASVETSPDALTEATAGAELAQVTVRPVSTAPPASLSVAVACVVWPTVTDVALSATDTLATTTGGVEIVSEIDPLFPSDVAVTEAEPAPNAVTRPAGEIPRTAGLDDVHPIVRPVNTLPPASFSVTPTCIV